MSVFDSKDVLKNPKNILEQICELFEINFSEQMLHWPKGRRDSDGVWADHWYKAVDQSTGFQPYIEPIIAVSDLGREIAKTREKPYQAMWEKRLIVG